VALHHTVARGQAHALHFNATASRDRRLGGERFILARRMQPARRTAAFSTPHRLVRDGTHHDSQQTGCLSRCGTVFCYALLPPSRMYRHAPTVSIYRHQQHLHLRTTQHAATAATRLATDTLHTQRRVRCHTAYSVACTFAFNTHTFFVTPAVGLLTRLTPQPALRYLMHTCLYPLNHPHAPHPPSTWARLPTDTSI